MPQSPAERPPPPGGPSGSPRVLCAGSPAILETDHFLPIMATSLAFACGNARPWWRRPEVPKTESSPASSFLLKTLLSWRLADASDIWSDEGPEAWCMGLCPPQAHFLNLVQKLGQWHTESWSRWSSAEGRDLVSSTSVPERCFAAVTNNPRCLELTTVVLLSGSWGPHPGWGSAPPSPSPRTQTEEAVFIQNKADVPQEGKKGAEPVMATRCLSSHVETSLGKTKPRGTGSPSQGREDCRPPRPVRRTSHWSNSEGN